MLATQGSAIQMKMPKEGRRPARVPRRRGRVHPDDKVALLRSFDFEEKAGHGMPAERFDCFRMFQAVLHMLRNCPADCAFGGADIHARE